MSISRRDFYTTVLLLLVVILSFAAGFLVSSLIEGASFRNLNSVDPEGFSVFWEAWQKVEENFIGEIPTEMAITYGAIRGSLGELNDPYTIFVEPVAREQERENFRGRFGGIGANIFFDEQGRLILSPIAGNPAERSGVLDGDILLSVDGTDIAPEMTLEEVAELLRGEEGTTVIISVIHPDETEPVDISIVRAAILLPSVSYRILEEDDTIGYIQLSRYTEESGREIEEAIVSLVEAGAERLILDLRHNGGGLRDAAVEVADHFLDKGPVVYQINRGGSEETFSSQDGKTAGDAPLVVLVDGATASAAEITAGALQDRERAILIGTPTFGKGSVQLVYDLSDGSSVHVTSARWLTPDRHQLDEVGLQPDILVDNVEQEEVGETDRILLAAIEYYQALAAN